MEAGYLFAVDDECVLGHHIGGRAKNHKNSGGGVGFSRMELVE
jgi:hypothetical protein